MSMLATLALGLNTPIRHLIPNTALRIHLCAGDDSKDTGTNFSYKAIKTIERLLKETGPANPDELAAGSGYSPEHTRRLLLELGRQGIARKSAHRRFGKRAWEAVE